MISDTEKLHLNDLAELSTSWHSYPKIYNLGHAYIAELLLDPVIVQEKVDGSQFSFGVFNGELKARSKGQQINIEVPEKLFAKAIDSIKMLKPQLHEGWTYRGEYLAKPKHNALTYDRVPNHSIILFDINPSEEGYFPSEKVMEEARNLGFEVVPTLFEGRLENASLLHTLLERTSCLGGQKIEGVVIKNYSRFGRDKKVLMGKHVSEAFKEVHTRAWTEANPKQGDILETLTGKYTSPGRWNKAIQHFKEAGKLTNSPQDIGPLLKEIQRDVFEECSDEIKADLFNWAKDKLARSVIRGFPEFYKEELLKSQFQNAHET